MSNIEDIIGQDECDCLRDEFNGLMDQDCAYEDVEDLLLGYGLEMDYVEQLMW
jgi:hypothetical protein